MSHLFFAVFLGLTIGGVIFKDMGTVTFGVILMAVTAIIGIRGQMKRDQKLEQSLFESCKLEENADTIRNREELFDCMREEFLRFHDEKNREIIIDGPGMYGDISHSETILRHPDRLNKTDNKSEVDIKIEDDDD